MHEASLHAQRFSWFIKIKVEAPLFLTQNNFLIISQRAFRPQIVKVGALSAPTQEMLLKYCLDLSYIQNGSYLFLLFVKT